MNHTNLRVCTSPEEFIGQVDSVINRTDISGEHMCRVRLFPWTETVELMRMLIAGIAGCEPPDAVIPLD